MTWAKDARNVVEKEGDLEMQSTLRATVLYSYSSDEDMVIETNRQELLKADIDHLFQVALRKLPPGIADAAVLKIQRLWVANSLPDCELIYALTYTYSQLHRVCCDLAAHLDSALDASIPHPTEIDPSSTDVARVRFIKFGKSGIAKHTTFRMDADPNYKPPAALLRLKEEFGVTPKPSSLGEVVAMQAKMAQFTFEHHGNHMPMLVLYDKDWKQIDFMSTAFVDQSDKFLFWRNVADRAFYLKAYAMIWTGETWLRDIKDHNDRPIRDLPIIGEQLHVVGADATGATEVVKWNISRPNGEDAPELTRLIPDDSQRERDRIFFIEPVIAAMKMARANNEW
ncbi:hypothetical protein DF143_09560 [Burkholderia cenocepacia]|nr:hypothetical protein DF143_09560 [Burkholderia cenocepacia]